MSSCVSPSHPLPGDVLAEFPLLAARTYLDTAAIGLVPSSVQQAADRASRILWSEGTARDDRNSGSQILDDASRTIAHFIGAPASSDVLVADSAMNVVRRFATWVRTAGSAAGNVVVLADDYPDLVEIWTDHCRTAGAELRAVPSTPGDSARARMAALAAACDERTVVVAVSHVHWVTGLTLPLPELAELRQQHGLLLVVDASQSLGVVPIDLDSTPVDLLVAAGFKWTGGTFGACAVTTSGAAHERLGGAAGKDVLAPSTQSYVSAYILGSSIEWLTRTGPADAIRHQCTLMEQLRETLLRRGAHLMSEPGPSGIIAATFDGRSATDLVEAARRRGVFVSERCGTVRFSPYLHTDVTELQPAVEAILG